MKNLLKNKIKSLGDILVSNSARRGIITVEIFLLRYPWGASGFWEAGNVREKSIQIFLRKNSGYLD